MVVRDLSPEHIASGAALLAGLDSAKVKVNAALWLYSTENEDWKLVLSLRNLRRKGPLQAYKAIQTALGKIPEEQKALTLSNVTVSPQYENLVKLLRQAIKTGKSGGGIRVSRNVINGVPIEDAYIYRLM